jgi:hypothetical protein
MLMIVYTQQEYGYKNPYKRPVSALQWGHHQAFTSASDLRQGVVFYKLS